MQILGKRSNILLIAVAISMLVAIGISFATWDNMSTAQAASGNLSTYANANVGDVITFGNYYQTGEQDPNDTSEYKKNTYRMDSSRQRRENRTANFIK